MRLLWSFKLILFIFIESLTGNITKLQCYECSNSDDCTNATLTSCFIDHDACVIVASWDGDEGYEIKIVKRCDSLSHCSFSLVNGSATHCEETQSGLRCVMCCTENGCNSGAIGSFPPPPPQPPVPEYKTVNCAVSEQGCKTSAVVKNDVIHVSKLCRKSAMSKDTERTSEINQCNVEDKKDLCVTCCNQECYNKSNSNDTNTSESNTINFQISTCIYFGLLTHYLLIHR